jgi:hypothetical protein
MISTTFVKLLQTVSAHQLMSTVPIILPWSRHLMLQTLQERQDLPTLLLPIPPILRAQQPQLQ